MPEVALGTPAHRMVCVSAFEVKGEDGSVKVEPEVAPVIAVAAVLWASWTRLEYHPLVVHGHLGIVSVLEDRVWRYHEIVVCTWPPEEDEVRLTPCISRVRANVEAARSTTGEAK